MKEFYTVVVVVLMIVGASTIFKLCYDFVVRCKKALEVAERLDYIGVEYNLSKLNRYVKEQKHKGCHKYQMSKVQEDENDSGI